MNKRDSSPFLLVETLSLLWNMATNFHITRRDRQQEEYWLGYIDAESEPHPSSKIILTGHSMIASHHFAHFL